MSWIVRHKFWTSVIALFAVLAVLSPSPTAATSFGRLLGLYIVVGLAAKLLLSKMKHKEVKTK